MEEKLCLLCSRPIPPERLTRAWTKFCSDACRKKNNLSEPNRKATDLLTSATVGAIQELKVAADLLCKGMQVFRAMSPSCDCDLAVLFESKLVRVEVTTGSRTKTGKLTFPPHDEKLYDVIAVVVGDIITYYPGIEVWKLALPHFTPKLF